MASQYSPLTIAAVWAKGHISPLYDPKEYRTDDYGNWIRFDDYGKRDSNFGWEIDHFIALANGGSDTIFNMRPLYWGANATKSDKI